jgi:hypothetical protein
MMGLPTHIPIGDKKYNKMEVEIGNDCTTNFEAIEDKLAYEKLCNMSVVELAERFKLVVAVCNNL